MSAGRGVDIMFQRNDDVTLEVISTPLSIAYDGFHTIYVGFSYNAVFVLVSKSCPTVTISSHLQHNVTANPRTPQGKYRLHGHALQRPREAAVERHT